MDLTTKLPSKFGTKSPSYNAFSRYYHMSSFGESKTKKILDDGEKGSQFVDYNCKQISRIYPGAKRQDSSNLKVEIFMKSSKTFKNGQRTNNLS